MSHWRATEEKDYMLQPNFLDQGPLGGKSPEASPSCRKLNWNHNCAKHCLSLTFLSIVFLLPWSDARCMPFWYCFCNNSCKEWEDGKALDDYNCPGKAVADKPYGAHLLDLSLSLDQDLGRCLQPNLSFLQLMIWKLAGSQTEQIPSRRHLNLEQDQGRRVH